MLTAYIHPRLGLPNFLKFEPFFLAALEEFDKGLETRLTMTGGLSPSTIAARMRDSLMGYRNNSEAWRDQVDPRFIELFAKHDGNFVIAGPSPEGEVWFRHRHKKGGRTTPTFHELSGHLDKYIKRTVIQPPTQAPVQPQSLQAKSCDRHIVLAYGQLRGTGDLDLPVIFPGPIEPTIIEELSHAYDLAFHFDAERNQTLML